MKENKSILGWLFNPFKYIAGTKALFFGLVIMLLLSFVGYLSKAHFNGALDIHYACDYDQTPYYIHLLYQLTGWGSLTIILYIAARIASKSTTRFIDIAGTLALSQAPLLLAALLGFWAQVHLCFGDWQSLNITDLVKAFMDNIVVISIVSLVTIIVSIWSIILKYNAYSISANIKGTIGGISFAIALIAAEIVSQVILYFVLYL